MYPIGVVRGRVRFTSGRLYPHIFVAASRPGLGYSESPCYIFAPALNLALGRKKTNENRRRAIVNEVRVGRVRRRASGIQDRPSRYC